MHGCVSMERPVLIQPLLQNERLTWLRRVDLLILTPSSVRNAEYFPVSQTERVVIAASTAVAPSLVTD